MKKLSAGILPYKFVQEQIFFFIAHPGGPFYRKKDDGFWGIVKGEFDDKEEPLAAAIREFKEETTMEMKGDFLPLTPLKQKSGKLVYAWALEKDIDPSLIKSNSFEIEWPPKSGIKKSFPEIDKATWFTKEEAVKKIIEGQMPLIEELERRLQLFGK